MEPKIEMVVDRRLRYSKSLSQKIKEKNAIDQNVVKVIIKE